MPLTSSMEDYLEAVLVLQQQKGYVRCVDVAELLDVKKPCATLHDYFNTTKKLIASFLILFMCISKCKWLPVALPVCPTYPITSPTCTC